MTNLLFDTHRTFSALREAGFDDAQANAMMDMVGMALGENVATKQDVLEVRNEMRLQVSELRAEMQKQGSDLRAEMQKINSERKAETQQLGSELRAEMQKQGSDLRAEMQKQGSDLRAEIQAMELRITMRMGGLIVAGVGLIIALDKLL